MHQADSRWSRFEESGNSEYLDSAIALQQAAVDSCSQGQRNRDIALQMLAYFLCARYEQWGEIDDLERAIMLYRATLELRSEDHPDRASSLGSLASSLQTRFEHSGRLEDIEEAIILERAALELRPDGHQNRSLSLCNLASSLQTRFEQTGRLEDLDEAILLERAALVLQPEGHPAHSLLLGNLASALQTRFEHCGRVEDIEEAIALERIALMLRPEGHPSRSLSLGNLANSLQTRFVHCGGLEDIEEAITLGRAVLTLRPEDHPDHCSALSDLAAYLRTRFERSGRMDDLDEAITLGRAVLVLRPESDLNRSSSLRSLARSLRTRFEYGGRVADLEEAIPLERAMLELLPEGHPKRPLTLGELASSLRTRFGLGGRMEDLDESIILERNALVLQPEDHPAHSVLLANLAVSLQTRFEHCGRMEDLEEAISLKRAVLELRPESHPNRSVALGNLATTLKTRFEHSRRMEDFEEAITLGRAALELRAEDHPDYYMLLGNLAGTLETRFKLSGRMEDLDESIALGRSALELLPEGHPNRSVALGNLAISLSTRFEHSGRMEDLEEAIALERAALALLSEGHPNCSLASSNLSMALRTRFVHSGAMEDIEQAITLGRAVLRLQPEGHPGRSESLSKLAESLLVRSEKEGHRDDYKESILLLRDAAFHSFSSITTRLLIAWRWTTIARSHDHSTLIEAHRTALSLLQRSLAIRPTLSEQHKFLCSDDRYQSLPLNAAAHAIDKGEIIQAVEFLEQGRALLWSQMRGFRTPLEQLSGVDKALAERFENCNRCLETLITSSESGMAGSGRMAYSILENGAFQKRNSIDEMLRQMRRLSEEQESIINDIRRIPEFEAFLKTSPFDAIRQAASEGPVIVLNHSEYRCDTIIVLAREIDPCVCIPLDKDFYLDAIELREELIRVRQTSGVGSVEYDEVLRRVMTTLWERVVSKVIRKLKELGINEGSRIWWCPTSVLTAFPFHAAGPYEGANGRMRYLLDDYISSYTPTLASLINARSGAQNGGERMLFVGDTKLPSAKKERDAIIRVRRFKQLLGDRATPESALSLLQRAHWVHFACHGFLAKEPFNSFLKLSGSRLTLLDIARANLPNAEFAFLSACHTAEQGPDFALDEALHLAAGMQFCGFRSVVGTMWQLVDRDAPFLAGNIYRYLMSDLEEGEIRFKRAAGAVRQAALNLRAYGEEDPDTGKVMTERWVNLVHIGA
ncbi:hypothetical protein ACEPAI_2443 [Sanghuangporus weigelae]